MKSHPAAALIQAVWNCRNHCQRTLFETCLPSGGLHVMPQHLRTMIDCIEVCQTTADLLTRNSPLAAAICATCADICESCAQSCRALGEKAMEDCAKACLDCAEACRNTSMLKKVAA